MIRPALQNLPWLPDPPHDFQDRCAEAAQDTRVLRGLAGYALDDNGLTRLSRALVRERRKTPDGHLPGLTPYRLGFVSNGTTKLVTPALMGSALRYGLNLTVIEGEFGQAYQEATLAGSKTRSAELDGILIAFDWRGLPGLASGLSGTDEGAAVEEALSFLSTILNGYREAGSMAIFVQNIAIPSPGLFGNLDPRVSGSQRSRIERFNFTLGELLDRYSAMIVDIAGLASAIGYQRWFDPKQWHMAKLPFSQDLNPLYGDFVARLVGASKGMSRKCLVLDLDNTLWGGVIGDDGLDGIVLGQGDAVGEAFIAMQETAKSLRRRGVILAVCSKNNEEVARAAFREHPDMILREEDISVFQANWQDKASNLQAIAAKLNIGIDSLVFVDDNPAEREQVRQVLPEVAVPELTDDPSDYPNLILSGGYFETLSFTEDDKQRADHYRANAERAQLAESTRDLGDYLSSLEMVIRFSLFDETGRSRIAQLTNRSNQFNLTTRRYDEAAISDFAARDDAFALQIRLADRFGDNGMISVVICLADGDCWEIDTWLMSCRVLNRRVEEAVLDVLAANALRRNATRLVGRYIPTDKNAMVRDHYRKLGFASGGTDGDSELWHLDLADYQPREAPMEYQPHDRIL